MNQEFFPGCAVVCVDDENAKGDVTANDFYIVQNVTHHGALLILEGVKSPLASCRFKPFDTKTGDWERVGLIARELNNAG